jgi:ribosomal-protein-alanine N-acetyltransferase
MDFPLFYLRTMREEDVPLVMALEKSVYPFPWTEGIMRDCVRIGYGCWTLWQADHLVGYLFYSEAVQEAHVLNLCIRPDYRRQGLAQYMMRQLISQLRASGAQTLFLEVRVSNQAALRLYEDLGFNGIGERKNYYPNSEGRENALVMAMHLG